MQAPTVSPLHDEGWVGGAVDGQADEANKVMDELAALGAQAILTTEIRSCRALKTNGNGPA